MNLTSQVKNVGKLNYTSHVGALGGKKNGLLHWFTCREAFHSNVDPKRDGEFFYVVKEKSPGSPSDVANFIYKIEEHLGVEKSVFHYTDLPNIIWVKTSSWWLNDKSPLIRFSLFTCCLRAGLNWNKESKNWYDVLKTCKYFVHTQKALARFLSGYTRYTSAVNGLSGGWTRRFSGTDLGRGLSQEEVNNLLQKPELDEVRDRVEKIAYFKWVDAGSPSGQCDKFWNEALKEFYA